MLFKPLAFAASAAAFLLVPEIANEPSDAEGVFKTLPFQPESFEVPEAAMSQTINVPCHDCKGKGNSLRFDFDVLDGKKLTLNGFELYPSADPWHGDLVASVVKDNGKAKEQSLGYSLAVTPEGMDGDQMLEVIGVELRVIEVGSRFVDGIPAVKVKIIKAATGEILIGNVEIKEISETDCDSMWCRTKDVFGELFKGFKGCGGGRHNGHKHAQSHGGHQHAGVVEGHHKAGSHHEHHSTEHQHRWGKLFKNIMSHIFLPVLMGVAAGVGVAVYVLLILIHTPQY